MTSESKILTWDDITPGKREDLAFSVSEEDMRTFAELSGDWNPIHTDPEFAKRKGFDGTLVYGGLLTAQISKFLGMLLPGRDGLWTGLNIQFKTPLMVGEPACLEVEVENKSEAAKMINLKIRITTGDTVVAVAKVEILFVE